MASRNSRGPTKEMPPLMVVSRLDITEMPYLLDISCGTDVASDVCFGLRSIYMIVHAREIS
jgi:hypothetical protein